MHALGSYIKGRGSFSKKYWGNRTPVYLKLAQDMTNSQWDRLYGMLHTNESILEELRDCSKPAEEWTDNPDEYFIVASDPLEE